MGRKNWIVAAALMLLLAGAAMGWYFASPAWTLKQMADAAQARDADKFSGYVDYPALRESTKSQLKTAMTTELTSGSTNGFEALGMMMGMSMVDNMVDGMLTPDGVAAMFAQGRNVSPSGSAPHRKPFNIEANNRELVRDGFDRFRLHDQREKGSEGDLIFERHGLSWRLAKIVVPPTLFHEKK